MTMMKYRLNRRAALGLLGGTAASALVPMPGARVNAQTLDKLSFQTNWRAQAEHGGFYLALANGIYKKYGIDAEIRPGGPQQNPSQLLLGGRVDMTMSTSFEAIRFAQAKPWDLILLDVMLPKVDGFDVCAILRRAGVTAPIIMLTARTQEAEKIVGLDGGADDYVTKPFSLRELRARIRAQLRRAERTTEQVVRFGECEVDLNRAEVQRGGHRVELTAQEFKLLELFVRNPGKTYNRDELLSGAWGYGYEGTARTVDNFVSQLRAKFEPDPEEPKHFRTVRGLGYRFDV